jgi:hypothetical protein
LLRAGVSAAVIREYHLEVTSPELQLARVTPHLRRVANELRSATEPLQITFRKERMQVRGLQEIIEEMEQQA